MSRASNAVSATPAGKRRSLIIINIQPLYGYHIGHCGS